VTEFVALIAMNLVTPKAAAKHECLFVQQRNTKEGSINVPLTSCLTGLESAV
jgi:hypothetical protein